MRIQRFALVAAATGTLALGSQAFAATVTFYDSFSALASAAAISATKDFNTDSPGRNYKGGDILPGVTASTNDAYLQVFGSVGLGRNVLFALGSERLAGDEHYQFSFAPGTAYNAIGFNVEGWNPAAPGPAKLEVQFADGSSVAKTFYKRGGIEEDPFYVGFTSDSSVSRIRWYEGPEIGGGGNEEVAFSQFSVGTVAAVPEPETYALFLSGLTALGALSRRKARRS